MSIKQTTAYSCICNGCGSRGPLRRSMTEAIIDRFEAGWCDSWSALGELEHWCPRCAASLPSDKQVIRFKCLRK